MSNKLFFLGCIPIRLLLVYIAYSLQSSYSPILLLATFLIGCGFWTIYVMGWRKTGIEVEGKPIWWNSYRPFHGTTYLLFTLFACMGYKEAWVFLLADVIVGILAKIINL